MFSNTEELRGLAIHFEKFGKIPYQDEWDSLKADLNPPTAKNKRPIMPVYESMSMEAQQFADHWMDIFAHGFIQRNGTPHTAEHMFYLNCVWMMQTRKNNSVTTEDEGSETREVADRVAGFPKFWDEDWRYFWGCEIAKRGITFEDYDYLCAHGKDLGLVRTKENFGGGLNHFWVKPRGVGASWKGGAGDVHNMLFVPELPNFIFADNSKFLADTDGIFNKVTTIRDFIQANYWFLWRNYSREAPNEYVYETGYTSLEAGSRTTEGLNTSITGVIVNNDPNNVRGKRGNAKFEEAGSFPSVVEAWDLYDSSTNNNGEVFAQARGFGTGGDRKNNNIQGVEELFRKPKAHRILEYVNCWEATGDTESPVAMFTPHFLNPKHIDKHGNSLIEIAKIQHAKVLKLKKESGDPSAVTRYLAEKPEEPNQAFISLGNNDLPVELAKAQLQRLELTNIDRKLCTAVTLEAIPGGGIRAVPNGKIPYEEYPVVPGDDTSSTVVIFQRPFFKEGKIPRGLYRISVDGCTHATANNSRSLFDIRVIENRNPSSPLKGDVVVAWYRGRFRGHDANTKACRILFGLAEMYETFEQVSIENDQPGEIISHAKQFSDTRGRKLTKYLAPQFEVDIVTAGGMSLKTKKTMTRDFGINVNVYRKEEGIQYYGQWLERPRGKRFMEDGEVEEMTNTDMIMCRAQLKEIIKWDGNSKTNADSLSSMIVAMFHEKELSYANHKIGKEKKVDKFFRQTLFASA